MSRALIAIGVSKAGNLLPLPGAIQDAKAIGDWATAQRFEHVEVLTDENDTAVKFDDVYDQVEQFISIGDLDRFIIYFAGHGYSPMPMQEVWLLSNYDQNGNEAINVTWTLNYANSYGSPNISLIADACRTTWSMNAPPFGGGILPTPGSEQVASQVDEFFAVKFGFPSQEVDAEEAAKSYGLFSKVLLDGLKGEALADEPDTASGQQVVTSQSLKKYVSVVLPNKTADLPGIRIQQPQTVSNWTNPDVYAVYPMSGRARARGAASSPTRAGSLSRMRGGNPQITAQPKVRSLITKQTSETKSDYERSLAAFDYTNNRPGVRIVGAKQAGIIGPAPEVEIEILQTDEDVWFFDGGRIEAPLTLVFQISRGDWQTPWFLSIAVYPGLTVSAIIDREGCWSMSYQVPVENGEYSDPGNDLAATKEVVAKASAYLRHGVTPETPITEMIAILRNGKYIDPALSILAANISFRAGDSKIIHDMLNYQIGLGDYTPFDLFAITGDPGRDYRDLVGAYPFMSSTWAAIRPDNELLDPRLFDVVPHLKRSLWTMTDERGAEMLQSFLAS